MTNESNQNLFPRCPDCGGQVRLMAAKGRKREYLRGVHLPVPDDFEIPTCVKCGQESMAPEIAEKLDAVLESSLVNSLGRIVARDACGARRRGSLLSDTIIDTFPTHTRFDFAAPTADMVKIEDVAHHLAAEGRFANATGRVWSVAAHSLLVSLLCEADARASVEDVLRGLLHDASEYVMRDLPAALKHLPELAGYRALEKRIDAVVGEAFGLPLPLKTPAVVRADAQALVIEQILVRGQRRPRGFAVDDQLAVMVTELYLAPAASVRVRFLQRYEDAREALARTAPALATPASAC